MPGLHHISIQIENQVWPSVNCPKQKTYLGWTEEKFYRKNIIDYQLKLSNADI